MTADRSPLRRRPPVLLGAVVVALAGCTTAGGPAETTGPPTTAAVTSTTAPATTTTTAPATTTTTAPIDPSALLSGALERYAEGYRFHAVVTVGETVAADVAGVVIGDRAQMTVTSGDGVADYLTTPSGAWVRVEGGEWEELEADEPFEPPLADLAAPASLTVTGQDADGVTAVAVFPAGTIDPALEIALDMLFVDGELRRASYRTESAVVTTEFSALDGATIEDPTPSD